MVHIGIDFDNTIVSYDRVFHACARNLGFIHGVFAADKERIKNQIKSRPDGETAWQKLQAEVYGKQIKHAVMMPGVDRFMTECRHRKIEISIISHKTTHAVQSPQLNLRQAALEWMVQTKLFDADISGIKRENVFFESTREEKIERIKDRGCSHFIDDLVAVFHHPAFPKEVVKILLQRKKPDSGHADINMFPSWREIYGFFFEGINQ